MPQTTQPRKIERAPAEYRKVHDDGLQSMVDVEDSGTRNTRSTIAAIIAMFLFRGNTEQDAKRNAAAAATMLYAGIRGSLLISRQQAARAADRFLADELAVIAGKLPKGTAVVHRYPGAIVSDEERIRRSVEESRRALEAMGRHGAYRGASATADDVKRASDAAKGYVKAWKDKAADAIDSRGRRGSNPTVALEDATAAVDHKVVTANATEVANAFNAEHNARVEELVREAGPHAAASLYLRWDAILDRGTCDICASLNGRVVPAKQGFGGYSPGNVHPRCRCVAELIWMPN